MKSNVAYVIIALQAVIIAGQWLGQPAALQSAQAQVPDAGGQRLQIIDELKQVNAKLDRIAGVLEGGKLEVRSSAPADGANAPRGR